MRVAVFGGTGFLGYDFVRHAERVGHEVVVVTTNPGSLTNVARHATPFVYAPYAKLANADFGAVDAIVNFAHPFVARDGLTSAAQSAVLTSCFGNARTRNPQLVLVHISTMSVYEPFSRNRPAREGDPLAPSRSDKYARSKVAMDRRLTRLPGSSEWQLIVRPTIVYGPYSRPWTDRIFSALLAGPVDIGPSLGRMQPISAHDVSHAVLHALASFEPGIVNLPGIETMTWRRFIEFFAGLVDNSSLVDEPQARTTGGLRGVASDLRNYLQRASQDPAFASLVSPLTHRLPEGFRMRMHRAAGIKDYPKVVPLRSGVSAQVSLRDEFFEADRLLDTTQRDAYFPDVQWSMLEDNAEELSSYLRFRFTDAPLDSFSPSPG